MDSIDTLEEDCPRLSEDTLKALQEFYHEQQNKVENHTDENWQLSQFWYDDKTAELLAKEALRVAGPDGRIACVSCPTIFQKLQVLKPDGVKLTLFEFDRRFEVVAGTDFVFFDYNEPVVTKVLQLQFDVVLADPPFLSEECLTKTADTIKFLAKNKIILCTGTVMENVVQKCLGLRRCRFKPTHTRNLANDFSCYTNYDLDQNLES